MNHSRANLMEFTTDMKEVKVILSTFTSQVRANSLGKSENLMHNKEQHQQSEYYKEIGEYILQYTDVLLFGPTDAKSELHNLLKADHHFDKINITVKHASKMTENQQQAFVRDHFSNDKIPA